ncbi:nuclear transport factor 2 family protein [Flavobacterium sp. MFBS3-15]|uniref:nuclear transport factor 2 family protein n=1 Tax=Flavobacterium sp. MFBS3-15 TaxID=2989816 RepID=UPI002235B03F|nr:nuclear transport factor 2 family protein [Flavobacterium sp. MFBS3-15]MCW4467523.1 nuclear transport factor 2 family protein [Flavobacterium sp. MFBS3-15]
MKQLFLAALLCLSAIGYSQKDPAYPANQKDLEIKILAFDKEVFDAYNTCNTEAMKEFFTEDLEFYHDKGGMTNTRDEMIARTKQNLCSRPGWKIRREAVPGTLKVYPLEGYGAILTGEHRFYVTENDKEELTGQAKFTHVFLLKDGKWKIARILSYDHGPAK